MQLIQLKIIAQKESPRLKTSPEVITQFHSEKVSDPFANIKQMTKIIANAWPIHTSSVLAVKITRKLKTRIIL